MASHQSTLVYYTNVVVTMFFLTLHNFPKYLNVAFIIIPRAFAAILKHCEQYKYTLMAASSDHHERQHLHIWFYLSKLLLTLLKYCP